MFIVVEGPDGAGKSTLVEGLAARIAAAGLDLVTVREPGGTAAAEWARRGAFDPALEASPVAELFFILAARADLVEKVVRPALESGRVVLSDRYELSTWAYQIEGRGLPRDEVTRANRLATGGLAPDLTLVLDIDPAVGRDRQAAQGKGLDRMELEDPTFHARVAEAFRSAGGPAVRHVDAGETPDRVEGAAWAIVREALGRAAGRHSP